MDCPQPEASTTAGCYNLIQNSDFSGGLSSWSTSALGGSAGANRNADPEGYPLRVFSAHTQNQPPAKRNLHLKTHGLHNELTNIMQVQKGLDFETIYLYTFIIGRRNRYELDRNRSICGTERRISVCADKRKAKAKLFRALWLTNVLLIFLFMLVGMYFSKNGQNTASTTVQLIVLLLLGSMAIFLAAYHKYARSDKKDAEDA